MTTPEGPAGYSYEEVDALRARLVEVERLASMWEGQANEYKSWAESRLVTYRAAESRASAAEASYRSQCEYSAALMGAQDTTEALRFSFECRALAAEARLSEVEGALREAESLILWLAMKDTLDKYGGSWRRCVVCDRPSKHDHTDKQSHESNCAILLHLEKLSARAALSGSPPISGAADSLGLGGPKGLAPKAPPDPTDPDSSQKGEP